MSETKHKCTDFHPANDDELGTYVCVECGAILTDDDDDYDDEPRQRTCVECDGTGMDWEGGDCPHCDGYGYYWWE